MPFIQHHVLPKEPTALANRTHVDLPGYDLWFSYVNLVYVVPATLSLSKFEDALSASLQLYPHVAGQLRCVDGRWFIELTNTPIPVDIEYKLNTTSKSFLKGDWVIQDDISPLISQQLVGVKVVNSNLPLLRVKLTFLDHSTCIGLSWYHSLGDAVLSFRLYHTLSQFYQCLTSEFEPPIFVKPQFPLPTRSTLANFSVQMPRLAEVSQIDPSELADLADGLGHVRWRFDNEQLEELKSALCVGGQRVSKLDCLTAYIIAVLNHVQTDLVKKVRYIISIRDANLPFFPENLASNLFVQICANVSTDMVAMATLIRDMLERSRRPEYIRDWVSVVSKFKRDAAMSGEVLTLPITGDMMVNSMAAVDFCSAHFGHPGETQYYLDRPWRYYLRIMKPNSAKGDDGVWRTHQSIEISLGVPPGLKSKVLETFARGVRYMIDKQPVHARM